MDTGKRQLELGEIFRSIFLVSFAFVLPCLDIPLYGLISLFVPLLPFIYLYRFGWNVGNKLLITGFILALLFSFAIDSLQSILFTLTLIPLGYVIAHSSRRNETPVLAGTKGIIVQSIVWLIYGYAIFVISGKSIYTEILQSSLAAFDHVILSYRTNEAIAPETLIRIEQVFSMFKTVFPTILPSFFASSLLMVVFFTMVGGNFVLSRMQIPAPWSPFKTWQLPDKTIWIAIAAGLLTLTDVSPYRTIGINFLIVFAVLFALQGFSIVVYFMNKWKVPIFFKAVLYITILFQSIGTAILITLGISSFWVDYRGKAIKKQSETQNDDIL